MGFSDFFSSITGFFTGGSSTTQTNTNTTSSQTSNNAQVNIAINFSFKLNFPMTQSDLNLQNQPFNIRQMFALMQANQQGQNLNDSTVFHKILTDHPNQPGDTLFQPAVNVNMMSMST